MSDKEVLAIQHFLIQGFPVPGLVPQEHSRFFPFPSIVDVNPIMEHSRGSLRADGSRASSLMTDKDIRKATGMSMHWACIGAWLTYMVSSSRVDTSKDVQGCDPDYGP